MSRRPQPQPSRAYSSAFVNNDGTLTATHYKCGHLVTLTRAQAYDSYEYCSRCWPGAGYDKPIPREPEEILSELFTAVERIPHRGAIAKAHNTALVLIEEYKLSVGNKS